MPIWTPRLSPRRGESLFRQIVQGIADDIEAGVLAPGAQLPPHRELCEELFCARGTVARAYAEAERLGLVRSGVGSGTFALAPGGGTRPYASLLDPPTVRADLSTSLPLSGIDPDPAVALRRLADRPDRKALLRYHPPGGLRRHRLAGVRWLERLDVIAQADDVLVCSGAQHALFVVLSHLAAVSTCVYCEELTYPGLLGVAEAVGLRLVPVAVDGGGVRVDALARAVRRHGPGPLYLMPTLHNPLGTTMSLNRRRAVVQLARSAGLFLVEDAANRMLAPHPPPALFTLAPERCALIASVSKVLSPGLRVAFLVGPREHRDAFVRRAWATQWMSSPLGAELVASWLEDGEVDRTLRRKRREAQRRHALLRGVLRGLQVEASAPALHAWIRLKGRRRSEDVVAAARAENIVVTPSSAFWTRTTEPPRAIRVSLGGVDDPRTLRRELERLAAVL